MDKKISAEKKIWANKKDWEESLILIINNEKINQTKIEYILFIIN